MSAIKRGNGRRLETLSGTEPVPELIPGLVSESVSEACSGVLTLSSRSPGVSPKTTVSSDQLSQDTSSSAVTVDYDEETKYPTHLKVLEGGSPVARDPTFTDPATDQHGKPSPDSSPCGSLPLDNSTSDRLESKNDEDRKNTTSGFQPDGVQCTAATNSESECLLVKHTSANVITDHTVTGKDEDIEHSDKNGKVSDLEDRSGTSTLTSEQTRMSSDGQQDGDGYSAAFKGNCAVRTLDVTPRAPVVADRKRTSVVVTRQRRIGKSTAIIRGRPADQVTTKPKEADACGIVSSALQNGIKLSSDDEDRTMENKRLT